MTTKPFILKWLPNNFAAEDLVKQTCEHLDRRKKALKDDVQNTRIVSSILAQRGGPFIVTMKDVPKKDVEALKGVLECLTGPVLTRGKQRGEYALGDEYRASDATFITEQTVTSKGRPVPPISINYGTIYRDGSQGEVPFKDMHLFGHSRPSRLQIVAPQKHWKMFVDGDRPPSVNWNDIEEIPERHDSHNEIMDRVDHKANMRGLQTARYGDDGFICLNPDGLVFVLDTEIIQFTNKIGQRPLLNITDIYGRQHFRWGSSTAINQQGSK